MKYGGVWMDPTVYCIKPLDEWLSGHMDAGVFFFNQPGPDRILANWFIASEPDNYVIRSLYHSLLDYWNENDFINLENKSLWQERFMNRLVNGRSVDLSQLWFHPFVRKVLRVYPYMIYHFMAYRLVNTDAKFCEIWNRMPKVSASGPHSLQDFGLLKPVSNDSLDLLGRGHPLFKLNWKVPTGEIDGSILEHLFQNY